MWDSTPLKVHTDTRTYHNFLDATNLIIFGSTALQVKRLVRIKKSSEDFSLDNQQKWVRMEKTNRGDFGESSQ